MFGLKYILLLKLLVLLHTTDILVGKVQEYGGCLDLNDMKSHTTTFPDAIKTTFKDMDIWEVPPNGQGITALIALNIISNLNLSDEDINDDGKRTHALVEALRLGFADAAQFITDMDTNECPVDGLLSMEYAKSRSELIHADKTCGEVHAGSPPKSSCTVSFQVCDSEGNSVSAVNSNYMVFGTGLVPEGCGFTLQNRGYNFTFEPGHPNCIAPGKRPYHTIIPGMATHSASSNLFCSFTNMGGFMQPQGHVQLLVNMLLRKLDPQTTVDQPRFCIGGSHELSMNKHYVINYEEGFNPEAIAYLESLGHPVKMISSYDRGLFGRAQIIQRSEVVVDPVTQKTSIVWCCGSDGRADGQALAY
jgi:gamma-glutamyltranspeptidase/glutathione hydrolase